MKNIPYTQPATVNLNDKPTDPFALQPRNRTPCKGDVVQGLSTRQPMSPGGGLATGSGSIFGGSWD